MQLPTTRWSVVLAAGDDSAEANAAIEALCATYWPPLLAYATRKTDSVEQAEDVTQGFFARLVEKRDLDAAPERGRFRAYLLAAFNHYLSNARDRERAAKRGGGATPVSLDALERPTADEDALTAEQLYLRRWAATLLQTVLARLRAEQPEAKRPLFEALLPHLVGQAPHGGYASVAGEQALTEGAARIAVHRLRRRYRQLLREEIAQTVDGPEAVEEELQELFEAVRGTPGEKSV